MNPPKNDKISSAFSYNFRSALTGYALMDQLKAAGIETVDCTIDKAGTQREYLQMATAFANREDLDWFISIHFNASPAHMGQGAEIYTYEGRQYEEAANICANLAKLGLKNRGIKKGNGYYLIHRSKAKAMLIEVCFCDNQNDVDLYLGAGAEAAAEAICKGICGQTAEGITHKPFEEFVGKIAKEDWEKRKIMLPSVVVAQAIKESAWGTSELAREANALFGIKKNGWTGRTLRYSKVIGCDNHVFACQYLQECGYATSLTYGESLVRDYIEKYHLLRFDSCSSSNPQSNKTLQMY